MNAPTTLNVTVRNVGSGDATAFQVVVTYAPKGSNDQSALDAQNVDGLAAGQSVQLNFAATVSVGGDFVFTATADSGDEVTESNEKDNSRTLELSTNPLPNLAFDSEGVIFATCIGGPDWNVQFDFGVNNIGKADSVKPFKVGIKWFMGGVSSGTLDAELIPDNLEPGTGYLPEFCRMLPGPGNYEIHLTIDPDNKIAESNEDDNEITAKWNIPCFDACASP